LHHNKCGYVSGTTQSHLALFSSFRTLVVSGPEKVVKIFLLPVLAVRMRNEKNCIPNSVGMFLVSKQSHPRSIFNFAYYGGARAQKVVKIRPKHFSTVLMGSDRNCTTNCMCMFRVPNVVI